MPSILIRPGWKGFSFVGMTGFSLPVAQAPRPAPFPMGKTVRTVGRILVPGARAA